MQKIIQVLLLSTLMAGHSCQKIAFDNSTLISPCTTGARSAVDTYLITGIIGDNITLALIQKWITYPYIKVLRKTSPQLKTICQLYMGLGTCQPFPTITCECLYNTTTDQARFTVSGPVQADDSNAIMFVQWQHQNGTFIYSNKNYTFPEIYDVNAAQLNLTVAGVTGNLSSGSCSFSLTLNKSNDLELCCSNTATPCYPQMSFNGAVLTNNTPMCVIYPTSQLASDGVTGNLVLSYSVCDLTDYRQGSSCTVTSKPGVYNKPGHRDPPNTQDNIIAIIVTLSVIIPVVVIALAVGIAYYFKAKSTGPKAITRITETTGMMGEEVRYMMSP